MSLPYGYTIRTSQHGVTSPPSSIASNIWERKRKGSFTWEPISGASGDEYTVAKDDRDCKVRKVERTQAGNDMPSNELQVENFTPPFAWDFIGNFGSDMISSIGSNADNGTMYGAFRDHSYRVTRNGGTSFTRYNTNIEVPIGIWNDKTEPYDFILGGYGGKANDDNVEASNPYGNEWFGGFPKGTFVYGAAKMANGKYITVDMSGAIWVADTKGGDFVRVSTINNQYITMLNQLQGSDDPWGVSSKFLWKFKGGDASNIIYDQMAMPFQGSGNSFLYDVAHDPVKNYWIAVGDRNHCFWSDDGHRSWQKVTTPFSYDTPITGACFAGNKFWITGSYLTNLHLASSGDGQTWTLEPLPSGVSQSGWSSPKMTGFGDQGMWTFNESSSPYQAKFALLRS